MSIYYRLKVLFYVDMKNFLEIKSRKQEVFVTCSIVVKTYEVEQQIRKIGDQKWSPKDAQIKLDRKIMILFTFNTSFCFS